MRPRTIEEVVGQSHILGPGKLLSRMLKADALSSLILHGPPGTGKTTLARLIAGTTGRAFEQENAAAVGVARIREIITLAERRLADGGRRTVLFLDEIHRFTRAQQDVLLGDVERGLITLIGATTENPLFAVNSALVSRSTLLRLEPLTVEEIKAVLRRAISDAQRGYGAMRLKVDEEALELWAVKSDGDARRALTALEVAVLSGGAGAGAGGDEVELHITRQVAEDSIQQKAIAYDHTGDGHYDTISAFIKSVRGSDPDAALYWLAHMLEAGEDPRFIARRLAILASEDIGNADPRALMIAVAAMQATEFVGLPECQLTLAQAVTYLALAPKSNACTTAIGAARRDVREKQVIPVPRHLQDKHYAGAKRLGHGQGYAYSHDAPDGIAAQDYLGVEKRYYEPTDRGFERDLAERLAEIRRRLHDPKAMQDPKAKQDPKAMHEP